MSILLFCFILGCSKGGGGERFALDITITKGGQPYKLPDKAGLTIVLIPVVAEGTQYDTYNGRYDPETGVCQIRDRDGKGIPGGQYKIALLFMAIDHTAEMQRLSSTYSQDGTSLLKEINSPQLTLDLDQL